MNADTYQPATANGQESTTGIRSEEGRPPFTRSKRGRLTARELVRRRRQCLLELLQATHTAASF